MVDASSSLLKELKHLWGQISIPTVTGYQILQKIKEYHKNKHGIFNRSCDISKKGNWNYWYSNKENPCEKIVM